MLFLYKILGKAIVTVAPYLKHNLTIQSDNFSEDMKAKGYLIDCLLYTSPSPRDLSTSRMPSSA